MEDSVAISARSYLEAMAEEMASNFIFVVGLGFKLNLDIHNNPINTLAFKLDYEDLHQERKMHMLPMAKHANQTTYAFIEKLRTSHRDKLDLLDGIDSYYNYSISVRIIRHFFDWQRRFQRKIANIPQVFSPFS